MSGGDGGVDQGLVSEQPFVGRQIIYINEQGAALPATVLEASGWEVKLVTATGETVENVGTTPEDEFELRRGTWATPERFEGAKIWAEEVAARTKVPDYPPEEP